MLLLHERGQSYTLSLTTLSLTKNRSHVLVKAEFRVQSQSGGVRQRGTALHNSDLTWRAWHLLPSSLRVHLDNALH